MSLPAGPTLYRPRQFRLAVYKVLKEKDFLSCQHSSLVSAGEAGEKLATASCVSRCGVCFGLGP